MMNIPNSYQGKPLVHKWTYHGMDGTVLGHVGRYQNGSDKKAIVPYFRLNGVGWKVGIDLHPRPLYGLGILAKHPKDKMVFVVEGEKAAAALQSLGFCAITSLGGSSSPKQAEWTALNGFQRVTIMPDNDLPGEHYARDVYRALSVLDSPPVIEILRFTKLGKGADVVDWLQGWIKGWDGYQPITDNQHYSIKAKLKDELKRAEPIPDGWKNKIGLVGSQLEVFHENPIEINATLKPVKVFDFELLPRAFKPWVADIALRMQCPPDYVAVSAMVSLSAIVGKKGLMHPKAKDDWTVCPNLWGLCIGRPSAMKTPAASDALKPLQCLEIRAKETYDLALMEDEAQGFIDKAGRELAEKEAKTLIKGKKFQEAKQLLLENPEDQAKPTRTRYLVNDATIEKLGELLNENPNGLMLYRDEISGFLKTIDREDRSNDRAFYLEAFNGLGSYTFDRIGRGTVDIKSVCLAMLGNIQPGVLRRYLNQAKGGAAGDDGMVQRFQLMVWPDLTDFRHIDQWPDKTTKDQAFDVFNRLADWEGHQEPARFTYDGQKLFDAWFCGLHEEIRADDIHPALESHYGKYKSLIPSLAVLIHLADYPTHSDLIGADAVNRAIAWGDYLKSHADRVYGSALDPVDENAKAILSKIGAGKLPDGFGTGDVKRGGWMGLDTLEQIKAALSRLVDYGWLREYREQPTVSGGRPSVRYLVHPKIFHKNAKQ
jgi:hypothetical protein